MRKSTKNGGAESGGGDDTPRWSGEPVCVVNGSPADLIGLVPHFDRRPFSMGSIGSSSTATLRESALLDRENSFYDLVIRLPLKEGESEIPVGVVSERYRLVQHAELFEKACGALKTHAIDLRTLPSELMLSIYGSKMALTFTLPGYDFDPGDGMNLKLQFHC